MKKIILYSSLAIVALLIACFTLFEKENSSIQVETALVKNGSINKMITATGTVEPLMKVEVGTQVSGVIEKILVDYNSVVKANQLIAELDKTTLRATVSEATASLNTALNEQDYQQKNYDRIKKLHDTRVISDADYEEALYKLNNAKSITEQRRSDLSRAKTNLGYASIYSPIDGVIISRSVDVGQTVAASYSTPTLFSIAQDLKQMQVEANVDEADIGQVKVGQRVTFTVDAYPDNEFSGSVTQVRLEPVEESNVITYTVIIKADNPDGKLMPGLTASITIYTEEINNILTIEMKAINFQPDQKVMEAYTSQHEQSKRQEVASDSGQLFSRPSNPLSENTSAPVQKENADQKTVWVKEGTAIIPKTIKVGTSDGISVQIITGLKAGDEVVLSMAATTSPETTADSETSSPFMPKPPGRKTK